VSIRELDIGPLHPPRKVFRVFIAHPKDVSDQMVEDHRNRISAIMSRASEATRNPVTIVAILGREDWDANFKRCGSWQSWERDVVLRMDYATRERFYSAIVVTDRIIGSATKGIVLTAIAAKLPALFFHRNSGLMFKIRSVVTINSMDFREGWEIVT
jgi:hypothetical protein